LTMVGKLRLIYLLQFFAVLAVVNVCPSYSFVTHSTYSSNSNKHRMVDTETKTDTPTSTATATVLRSSLSLAASSSDNDSEKGKGITIGFIGCGTIASSIVKGLVLAATEAATAETEDNNNMKINSMIVSKRSISKSNDLKEILYWYNYRQNYNDNDHPTFIEFSTTENNQEILNQADLIFVTVLPNQAKDVLQKLQFDSNRHILISLVSTTNLQELATDSKLDESNVCKMICLPSIARHEGIALLCCGGGNENENDDSSDGGDGNKNKSLVTKLLNTMGGCIVVDTENELESCMVATCTMGPLYGTMKKQRDWILGNTSSLSKYDATQLVMKQFQGAISDASYKFTKNNNDDDNSDNNGSDDSNKDNEDVDIFDYLIQEQTPGGLNEQALQNCQKLGLDDIQQKVMDATVNRIRGISDGNL